MSNEGIQFYPRVSAFCCRLSGLLTQFSSPFSDLLPFFCYHQSPYNILKGSTHRQCHPGFPFFDKHANFKQFCYQHRILRLNALPMLLMALPWLCSPYMSSSPLVDGCLKMSIWGAHSLINTPVPSTLSSKPSGSSCLLSVPVKISPLYASLNTHMNFTLLASSPLANSLICSSDNDASGSEGNIDLRVWFLFIQPFQAIIFTLCSFFTADI
ncbi:hypothetical protein M5689_015244 [Euphorbia peplus]|nr:hypothetical protein M5689_015244 [Euphorbia peplus]